MGAATVRMRFPFGIGTGSARKVPCQRPLPETVYDPWSQTANGHDEALCEGRWDFTATPTRGLENTPHAALYRHHGPARNARTPIRSGVPLCIEEALENLGADKSWIGDGDAYFFGAQLDA